MMTINQRVKVRAFKNRTGIVINVDPPRQRVKVKWDDERMPEKWLPMANLEVIE